MKAIEVSSLQFSYPKGPTVLDIPSFFVEEGEKVFLRGSSGSGKTTLLNLLGGILPFSNGEIKILGKSLKELNAQEKDELRAKQIGFIFQTLHLIPYLSPLENILLPFLFTKEHVRADLNALLSSLHLDKKNIEQKKTHELSLGQQQRIAIARAFVTKPKLIIADEPTSSIDYLAKGAFIELLLSMAKEYKQSILFVSHDPSLETYFDRSLDLSQINRVERIDREIL